MDEKTVALEITRLKMRAEIHEALLLQMRPFVPQAIKESEYRENKRKTLEALEEIAFALERDLLSSPRYADLSDLERALYSDEIREIVEHMKSYVSTLGSEANG